MTNLGSVASKKSRSSQMEKDGTTPGAKRQQVANQAAAGSQETKKDNKPNKKNERLTFADVAKTTADLYVLTKKGEALTRSKRQLLSRHINLVCVPWMMVQKTLPTIVQWTNRRRGKAGQKHTVLR